MCWPRNSDGGLVWWEAMGSRVGWWEVKCGMRSAVVNVSENSRGQAGQVCKSRSIAEW
jgi:hypothetical protein